MRTHVIPTSLTSASRYPDEAGHVVRTDVTAVQIRCYSRHQRGMTDFSLTYRDAEIGTRLVQGGPVVYEPIAYMIAQGIVIQAHYPNHLPQTIDAEVGDRVEFAGHTWTITDTKSLSDPDLELL